MKKIKILITIFIMPLFIWNCDTNEPKETTDEFSDEAVKFAVYNGPKYTSDFFNEDLSNVVLNYIRESDVITFTEPATDDYNTALDFIKIRLRELGLDTTKLVDGLGNDKYFEYRWYPDSSVNHPPYYFRVHKNSYFEGAKFGSQDKDFYQIIELGTINFRPFTLQLVKEFFDQLWFYKHYNLGGAVVLKRTVSESLSNYHYTIYFTHTVFGDYGIRDKIGLLKGEFDLNKSNGMSQIKYTLVKEVLGNSN